MRTIAIVSAVGGAGRTTLTAALAGLLVAREHVALAVECDPRNVLAMHFGLRESAREGLVTHLAGSPGANNAWSRAALQSDDGVLVLPWGSLAAGAVSAPPGAPDDDASTQLDARPGWLRELLARVDLPPHAIALIDAGTWPSAHARQAIDAADLVLGLLTPCATACATLPRFIATLAGARKPSVFVANAVLPARQQHMDVIALLRARLGSAMLPYLVHADTGVPAALAAGENFCLSEPSSQAAHDLNGIASWISHWSASASPKAVEAPDAPLAPHPARGGTP